MNTTAACLREKQFGTKNIKNEPFVGAHFFAFDVRSAQLSPRRPFAKRSAGPAD